MVMYIISLLVLHLVDQPQVDLPSQMPMLTLQYPLVHLLPAAVLLVGGGGGGGAAISPNKWSGGGGGAGGYLVNPNYTFTGGNTTCEILIGQGGEGGGFSTSDYPKWGCRACMGDSSGLKNPAGPFEHRVGGGGGGGHDSGPGGQPGESSGPFGGSGGGGSGQNNPSNNPAYTSTTNGKGSTGSQPAPSDGTGTW